MSDYITTGMAPTAGIATQADYADAVLTARRAKNTLFLLLLLFLLAQLTIFFLVWSDVIKVGGTTAATVANPAMTADEPVVPGADISTPPAATTRPADATGAAWAHYGIAATTFLGMVFALMLTFVLLVLLLVLLNSRALGVAGLTSAFIWMLLLLVILFPYYALLNYGNLATANFRVPGVLYTWQELLSYGHFKSDFSSTSLAAETILRWARFVGYPIVGLILLLVVQVKSGRGLKLALGEADVETTDVVVEPVS